MILYDGIKIDEVQEYKYISNHVGNYNDDSVICSPVKMGDLKKRETELIKRNTEG